MKKPTFHQRLSKLTWACVFGMCISLFCNIWYGLSFLEYVGDDLFGINDKNRVYDSKRPLIFIGGVPRSGTTLLRAMLDSHRDIRCGQETRVIPAILKMRHLWEEMQFEMDRIKEAGISNTILDTAFQNFILQIIIDHGTVAKYLCDKDPFNLKYMIYLKHLFPNSKFLLMIRDGRAVVHSIMTNNISVFGFELNNQQRSLKQWNLEMSKMYALCVRVGPEVCLPIYYEQLVLFPKVWLKRILSFLGIGWSQSVLHHQDYIEKRNGVLLSKLEMSTNQVMKPVYISSLWKWIKHYPADIIKNMDRIAPMLKTLGYDPEYSPPVYAAMDVDVRENTLHLKHNKYFYTETIRDIFDKPPYNISLPQVNYVLD